MSGNIERFTGRVAEYEQYRERYDPDVILPRLREWCGLTPEWVVADIGAGTGMLSDVFLANGNRVIAIEPNAEMRDACERRHAGESHLRVVDGTAETTTLPGASVEMVSAGRALHWFDLEKAMAEFRRILKSGGWVAVVALGRAEDGREENETFAQAMEELMPDRYRKQSYAVYDELKAMFPGGEFHHEEIRGEMQLDWRSLLGMTISMSHAPLPDDARYPEFERKLRGYFERFEKGGEVALATRCWVDAGRFEG
jgi:ubiquinone/menaquinone biosynthesis C-methylase UbiE